MKDAPTTTFNEKAISTNLFVALYRTFTNIPFAKEIYEVLKSLNKLSPKETDQIKNKGKIPYFEARYLITERLLRKSEIQQVLELASGMSPRGLQFSLEGITYVEVDFPDAIDLKKEVLEQVCGDKNITVPPNLFLIGGNVLDKDTLNKALACFDNSKPIAITCEGLLRYISFEDKDVLLRNIHDLLSKTGGVWITPDIRPADEMTNDGKLAEEVKKRTGIDGEKNLFKSLEDARVYFQDRGFVVEQHSPMEVMSEMVSPKRLEIGDREVEKDLSNRYAFVLSA